MNTRARTVRASATLAMNEECHRLLRQGRKTYKLGFGQSPFPVPRRVVEALQANASQKDYLPVKGLPALRAAVADFHRRRYGIPVREEDVLIGPGSKELMFHAQLVFEGDVVIPSPSWVSYEPQANLLGRRVCWLATAKEDGWRLTPGALERLCRTEPDRPRLVILNYPSNPTGLTFGDRELEGLARVAQKYGLVLLSDEIYGELHHTGSHASIARYYPEGTVISGGLSKWCGAGGWRLGTFCFPSALAWLREAMACVGSETYSAASAPIQYAALRAYQGDAEIEAYLAQARRILRSLGRFVAARLRTFGADVADPDGAFYLFPDFCAYGEALRARGITSSAELCTRLLTDTGVALLPGSDFGCPAQEFTCRLAYVDFDGERCLAAAARIPSGEPLGEDFLHEHCGEVLAATDLIGEWMGRRA